MNIFLRRIINRFWPMQIDSASVSTRVISPGIEKSSQPAFFLDGEFDAVKDVVNGDRELESRRITGDKVFHLPTIEYVIKNAVLNDIYLYSGCFLTSFPSSRPLKHLSSRAPTHFDHAVLSTNILSGLEFGHWARDSLVTELHGVHEGAQAVGLSREPWPHESGLRKQANLPCHYPAQCKIDRLIVLDDRGHNTYWEWRFRQLRQRMRGDLDQLNGLSAGPLVFLSRGKHARVREPSNIDEIKISLEAEGFRTLVPSELSVPEIRLGLRDAKIVVSAEGSNLNHVHFFAPDGVALITLQDPNRFYSFHKSVMQFYDGRFGFVVGRPDSYSMGRHAISISDLFSTISLVS